MGNKKKKTIGDYALTILLVVAIGIFIFSAIMLVRIWMKYQVSANEYSKIEDMAVTSVTEKEGEEGLQPPISVDFDELKRINKDVVGWLYVESLGISYPLVKGKDNDQYLHTTYMGTYDFAGSIFLDYENSSDFKDPNTIIYGHNMKNGTMFGSLKKMVTDKAYDLSPYIWILTPDRNYRYIVFSAYTTAVESDTYTLFKKHNKEYGDYLLKMKKNSEIDTGETQPVRTENIVTLSTCTGNSSTRFVVQGVQLKE